MNSLARSVLNLASYDDRCDDISLPTSCASAYS